MTQKNRFNLTIRMLLTFALISVILFWFLSNQFQGLPEGTMTQLPAQIETIEGEVIDTSTLKGKPLVINFWATWCPPCLVELPGFVKVAKEYEGRVSFIGFAVNSPLGEIQRFKQKLNINFPLANASMQLVSTYRADTLPTTYLINSEGEVAWSHHGYVSESELREAVKMALTLK